MDKVKENVLKALSLALVGALTIGLLLFEGTSLVVSSGWFRDCATVIARYSAYIQAGMLGAGMGVVYYFRKWTTSLFRGNQGVAVDDPLKFDEDSEYRLVATYWGTPAPFTHVTLKSQWPTVVMARLRGLHGVVVQLVGRVWGMQVRDHVGRQLCSREYVARTEVLVAALDLLGALGAYSEVP